MKNAVLFFPSLLLIASCALLPQNASAQMPDARAEEDRRIFADGLFSRGFYAEAAAEYQRLLKDFPNTGEQDLLLFRQGEALRIAGKRRDAILAYNKLRNRYPQSPLATTALFKTAAIFTELGDPDSSEELYRKLLQSEPEPAVRELALYYHAAALEELKRTDEAISGMELLLRDFPSGEMAGYARLSLGRLYALPGKQQNKARSSELLDAVVKTEKDPRLVAEALFLTASAEYAAQNYKAAADRFVRLLEKYPDDIRAKDARFPAAWAFCKSGRPREAMAQCDAALAAEGIAPAVAVELRYIRAQSLFELVRLQEAFEAFSALAADPEAVKTPFAARARYQAALCAYKKGDFETAISTVSPLLQDSAMACEALWLSAQAASNQGEKALDTAIEQYRRLIQDFPESGYVPDALFRLGAHYQQRASWSDAAATYHMLVERFPQNELAPRALFASAASLAKAGQQTKALVEWQTFLRDYPGDEGVPEALFQLAVGLIREERYLEAAQTIDQLLREHPKAARRAEAFFWQGELRRNQENYSGAVESFRQSLASNPSDALRTEARFSLAISLQADKQDGAAAEIFQSLLSDSARSRFTPSQLEWLISYQLQQKQFEKAARTANLLIEQAPDEVWKQLGYTLLGRVHYTENQKRKAEEAYQKACDIPVSSEVLPEATLRLGELLLERGDAENASKYFRLAVNRCADEKLQPLRIHAYVGLGHAALAMGNKEDAVRYLFTVCILYHDPEILPPVMEETIQLLESLGQDENAEKLRDIRTKDYPEK